MTGRLGTVMLTSAAAALVLASLGERTPVLIWNASDSIPIGLYRLEQAEPLFVTELVAIRPPEPLASFLDFNGILPAGVPMLKRVLALPGQTVCRDGLTITVDGVGVGEARLRDGRDRPLPAWRGCLTLLPGEIFVMSWQSADSFDGRYFGPITSSAIIGEAVPIWVSEP